MQQPRTWGRRAIALLAGVGLATGVVLSMATGAGAQSASTPGVTAKDITLGYISSETGVAASASEGSANGCKARIGAENAKGGVNGRKIKLEAIDDQSANNLNNAKDLVQNRNAFIVINDSPFAGSSYRFLNDAGVPRSVAASTAPTTSRRGTRTSSPRTATAPPWRASRTTT